ncbi:protein of unknown function [Taphrina deformans PYCC 5710]|uniref:Uncharacterized protein n=1 Tax=Taphrina deformans (strain PYCC 5710 / ATCC 11124 / CBS 356.35 / IMI 108563 / JCM 9778 / NBRC 8474) TaxID=1097556 RepID=R4XET3_TAPDE|nr:protein of unknown function [Taphrina deformans PYCC 5710]|eukprot:CCG82986.1 protein of unknown function [Taphrina deformans PYCC 5710]
MVAAQNTDLQRVWRLVQELSAQLSANQQETERLRRHIELNPSYGSGSLNGLPAGRDKTGTVDGDGDAYRNLRRAYTALADDNVALKAESDALSRLCAEYELGLTRAMDQIRTHQHEVTASTIELHRNYSSIIDGKNAQNAALARDAVDVQGQIVSLNRYVREALHEQTDVGAETIIETLVQENAALRDRLHETEARLDAFLTLGNA